MIQLNDTSACLMRDELIKARYDKKITLKQITDRLCELDIPDWLQSQILEMTDYRKYERTTCAVEQAMEAAVCYKIVEKLLKEEKN